MSRLLQTIQNWSKPRKIVASVLAGVVFTGAGTAVVLASIPDSSGVIHACYSTGFLARVRIIDNATQTCNSGETAITWNQQGPAGPQGPTGPQGAAGPNGFVPSLVNADFSDFDVRYHNFQNEDFGTGANFRGAIIKGSDFTGAFLSGVNFRSIRAENTNFTNANLSDLTQFDNRSIIGPSNFTGANLTNFSSATTTTADFNGSNLTNTNLNNAQLVGIDFTDTTVNNTNFTNALFQGSNLAGTDFSNAVLTGTTWNNTTCSDGTNSNDNGNTCLGHLVP